MLPLQLPQSAVVKSTARVALKNKWPAASLAALTLVLTAFIFEMLKTTLYFFRPTPVMTIITLVESVFLLCPLFFGVVRYFYRLTAGTQDELDSIFYYFSSFYHYKRILKLTILLLVRLIGITIVAMLPYLIVRLLSGSWLYGMIGTGVPLWTSNLRIIESFFRLAGNLLILLAMLRYYLVPVIVVMDEDLLLLEAVHISCMVAKRSWSSFLGLCVTCAGWIFLSFLVLPLVFTAPFLMACYVIHCRFAIVHYNLSLDYYETSRPGGYQV